MSDVLVLEDPDAIAAATHPVRVEVLAAMRRPTTAAAVARATGRSRQSVAYHVRELAKVGLLRHAGERRNGNFVEQLYEAVAPTVVVSPRATWGDDRRDRALADQVSLRQLVEHGERLQREAAVLLDRAAFDGEDVPSASVTADVRFASDDDRAAFLAEYVELVGELARRYGSRKGQPFRVVAAVHPTVEEAL